MAGTPLWRQQGNEPDVRFTLANERTFLAWIRTALALLASGVAFEQFATRLEPRALVLAVSVGLAALAGVLSLLAYRRWRNNEIAMRLSRALPHSRVVALLSIAMALVCAALGVAMLVY